MAGFCWTILYVLCVCYLVVSTLYLAAIVYHKFFSSASQNKTYKAGGGTLDDLFVHRLMLVLTAASYVIFVVVTSSRAKNSSTECYVWNFMMGMTIGLEKAALFLFLFYKQDVIKNYIQEPRSACDKFILCLIPLVPLMAIADGSTTQYDFVQSVRCDAVVSTTVTLLLVIAELLDIVISLALLRSFVTIIKRHVNFNPTEPSPRKPRPEEDNSGVNSEGQATPEAQHRRTELQKTMVLNSRSCILSVFAFAFAIIFALTIPMATDDTNVTLPLILLSGCTSVFIDATAMMVCSPQIWKSAWKIVRDAASSGSTWKQPAQMEEVGSEASPKGIDAPRKPTLMSESV